MQLYNLFWKVSLEEFWENYSINGRTAKLVLSNRWAAEEFSFPITINEHSLYLADKASVVKRYLREIKKIKRKRKKKEEKRRKLKGTTSLRFVQ